MWYVLLFGWMLALQVSFLLVACAMIGWGALGLRILSGPLDTNPREMLRCFWFGAVVSLMLLQIWHFFLPVSAVASLLMLGIGIGGLIGSRAMRAAIPRTTGRIPVWWIVPILGISLVFANQGLTFPLFADSGLYHLQLIKWNQEHPLLPGLANLHNRYAFNNSSFLWHAAVLHGPWYERGYSLVNNVLALGCLVQACAALHSLKAQRLRERFSTLCETLLIVPVLFLAADRKSEYPLTTLCTDVTAAFLHLAAICYALRYLCNRHSVRLSTAGFRDLLLVFGLLAATVCIKSSNLAFSGLFLMALLAVHGYSVFRTASPNSIRQLVVLILLPAAILVPWMIRGVFLSGYPLYPLGIFPMPVDWRVPEEARELMRSVLLTWARQPGRMSGVTDDWLLLWLVREPRRHLFVVLVPLIAGCVVAGMGMLARKQSLFNRERRTVGLVSVAVLVALVAWFVTAPDPRYAIHLFFTVAILLVSVGLLLLVKRHDGMALQRRVAVVLTISLLATVGYRYSKEYERYGSPHTWRMIVIFPPPNETGCYRMEEVQVIRYTSDHGFEYWVPKKERSHSLFNCPLPAAPSPKRDLSLRRAGELRSGFKLVADGAQPSLWP